MVLRIDARKRRTLAPKQRRGASGLFNWFRTAVLEPLEENARRTAGDPELRAVHDYWVRRRDYVQSLVNRQRGLQKRGAGR